MTLATGSKPTRIPNVRLADGQTMRLGTNTITVKKVTPSDDSTEITFGLSRRSANTISAIKIFRRQGRSDRSAAHRFGLYERRRRDRSDDEEQREAGGVEFEVWQNLRQVKQPFNLTAGPASANDPRPPEVQRRPPPPAGARAQAHVQRADDSLTHRRRAVD